MSYEPLPGPLTLCLVMAAGREEGAVANPEAKEKVTKPHHPAATGAALSGAEDSGGLWPSARAWLEEAGAGGTSPSEKPARDSLTAQLLPLSCARKCLFQRDKDLDFPTFKLSPNGRKKLKMQLKIFN